MLKMEPEDYDENAIDYDDYYEDEDQTLQDYTGRLTLQSVVFFHTKENKWRQGGGIKDFVTTVQATHVIW